MTYLEKCPRCGNKEVNYLNQCLTCLLRDGRLINLANDEMGSKTSKTCGLIPCGTNTLSKGFERFTQNAPKYFVKGEGAYCYDETGKKYLDYVCGLGAITLGHAYPSVVEAVTKQIKEGTIFSLSHPLETELAEKLSFLIPCCEMARFGKNGADVTSAAIRLSRAITGRKHILQYGYHGAQDWYIATTTRNAGVPDEMKSWVESFDYNIESFMDKWEHNHYAAVIMEPHVLKEGRDDLHTLFLQAIKNECQKSGTLLIFDEMVTGFRYHKLSAQAYFDVTPDLACFGKGMANGFPISTLVGKRDLMKEFDKVFFSSTFGGELSSIAAAIATIDELYNANVPKHIYNLGMILKNFVKKTEKVKLIGMPQRQVFEFQDQLIRAKFLQEMYKRQIFFGVPIFFNLSMKEEEAKQTAAVINDVIDSLDNVELEGPIPRDVFEVRKT